MNAAAAIEAALLGGTPASFEHASGAAGWAREAPERWCWRCGGTVGPGEADRFGCAACRHRKIPWSRAVRLGAYDGVLRDAIHALKYHADRRVGRELARLLASALGDALDAAGIEHRAAVLVPVPTTDRRRVLRNRGVDHTLTLARGVSRDLGIPVVRALRRRHRPAQTAVSPGQRTANVRGAFSPVPGRMPGRTHGDFEVVVLIDDVRTTGATLTACCRALARLPQMGGHVATRGHGEPSVSVWAATCAVSERGGRRGSRRGEEGSGEGGGEKNLDRPA